MRIGIDAKFLTHPQKGGFKTYTENLISAMAEIDNNNEYILYLDRQPVETTPIPDKPNFISRVVSGRARFYGMPWREQFSLPPQILKDRVDVFHSPCLTAPLFLGVPFIVTIHDMIWRYPNRYSVSKHQVNRRKLMEWYYRLVPELASRRANAIITVSNASKNYINKYMGIQDDRIYVTHEAANSMYHPIEDCSLTESIFQKNNIKSNFILGIGSADPRKNIKTLIGAYAALPESLKQSYKLAIVYNHKLLKSTSFLDAEHLGISKHVQFLEEVSDRDLVKLYNLASLFVFPSLEEGFGLPPLEAMACGTPVLAANNSSIPEIVGDAALQFSAENVKELADLITYVLTNPGLQNEMAKSGLERSASFTWRKCALETLSVYNNVASEGKKG